MTMSKTAVTIPAELVEGARRAVSAGRASGVSAYVARAMEDHSKLDDLTTLLEETLAASGGPLTSAEQETADCALNR